MTFAACPWPSTLPSDTSALTKYPFSATSNLYFCSTCGATVFWVGQTVQVTIGVMENAKDLVEIYQHVFIGDTIDGGISDWVSHIGGKQLERWKFDEGSEEVPVGWTEKRMKESGPVKAWCKCKGVEFVVTPPTKASGNSSLPITNFSSISLSVND